MAGFRERLQARIAQETQEIARIKSDATANVQAANDRKAILQAALDALTPELEQLLTKLSSIGVKVTE